MGCTHLPLIIDAYGNNTLVSIGVQLRNGV